MNLKNIKRKEKLKIISLKISGNKNKTLSKDQLKFKALEEGTFFARDLVSEPGNILHPDEYAKRIKSLKKYGLKISIFDEKKMKKLGMNALILMLVKEVFDLHYCPDYGMEKLARNNSKPLAFVGKGVCFDTGGYLTKIPAIFMEE